MKYKRMILISNVALLGILAYGLVSPVLASTAVPNYRAYLPQRARPIRNEGSLIAQRRMLGERLRERERARAKEVEEELEKNPKLVDDPNYLAQHPKLARYIKNNPEAKQKIERDPKAFFANMENGGKMFP